MPSRQQAKGRTWERAVAKDLSAIFNGSFVRTAGSGAYTGGKNAFRKDQLSESQKLAKDGDISPPDELKFLEIECKSYANLNFNAIITGDCKQLDKWLEQARVDGKLWFLVFKINNKGAYIAYDKNLDFNCGTSYAIYNDVIVCSYENFFETNKSIVLKYNKQYETQ